MDDRNCAPSKLLPGEKCHVCEEKPARGIKYNAISCDSCRVFFRRIVLIKDRDPARDTWNRCTYDRLRKRDPELPERQVRLKCQHCRLMLCYANGMADHYITTSEAGRKRKQAIVEAQQRFEDRKRLKQADHHRELVVYDDQTYINMKTVNQMYFTRDQDTTARCLTSFWDFYMNPTPRLIKMPSDDSMLYNEKFVTWMRKRQTAKNIQGKLQIGGLCGAKFSTDNLKELGLLSGFVEYFEVTKKLKSLNPDSVDLAFLSALAVLTCDRGVPLSEDQARLVYSVQETVGEMLHRKCRMEGNTRKFTQLIEILATLRHTVRQVDIEKIRKYKAKIVENKQLKITEVKD